MPGRFDVLLFGGAIASPTGVRAADIGIRDGRIASVGDLRQAEAADRVDVTGLHILPGVIDSQVHFREPGLTHKEDLESGTRAAVAGGVTTIFDEPNTDPTTTTAAALSEKLARASGRAWCHYAFWVGASMDNLDDLAALEQLPGTPGIGEVFMGSSTGPLLVADDASLRRVLQNGSRPVAVHSEDEERLLRIKAERTPTHAREHPLMRDVESSRLATERILRLSRETGRPIHVLHVSTEEELPLLAEAKRDGLGTTCEVTPQHLSFNAEDYERLGSRIQMNTPIREERHRRALWRAVQEGLFDVFGSDHAPHTLEEKARPYPASPSGMPGVQTMLPVLLDSVHHGGLTLERLVAMTSFNPARLFGVPTKGQIAPGFDADLVAVDLKADFGVEARWLQSKCGWSPFEGRRLTGLPVHTLVGGGFALREGELGEPGLGRMVEFGWKGR
ncbi:MAG: dihydroorotase [Fimbriimonadaceae bacterium]|nr:dihydroorotase [Fimbriimonadaceae bacterium]QYK54824.1 MAG: dihydroorotase [Fimbriimonadaceae bacterium]